MTGALVEERAKSLLDASRGGADRLVPGFGKGPGKMFRLGF